MTTSPRTTAKRVRLGGMALANGLLVHGPTGWSTAIRTPDGQIRVRSGSKPRLVRGWVADVPVLRGIARMAEAVCVVPAARISSPGARLAMERREVAIAVVGASVVSAVSRRFSRSVLTQETIAALAGLAPALVALRTCDAARWHAVEHKSIAAYEAGGIEEVAHADEYPKEHSRCGTNLVAPLLATNVLLTSALRTVVRRPSVTARTAVGALGLGTTLELFSFASNNPQHPVSRAVHRMGHLIQAHVATKEPHHGEMAVGQAAMSAIVEHERSHQ